MGSIFDYISWRGDLSLEQSPFNPVDNIILTHLSYLALDNIVPGPNISAELPTIADAAKVFETLFHGIQSSTKKLNVIFKEDPALLEALGKSRRFGGMRLAGFVNQIDPVEEKQFAALTILTGDNNVFITYRGTDDTLVGWKEDCNMAFSDEIPAHGEALRYLEKMGNYFKTPLRIGGHSKGGNLGVYAASFCSSEIKNRITEIYINDAPGFSNKVLNSEGYQKIKEKIRSYVPQGSIIGMLFEHDTRHTVVKSNKTGILQHDVYSWEVIGQEPVSLQDVSKESRFFNSMIKEWMAGMNMQQRKDFIESLFTILHSTEAKSFPEIGADWSKNSIVMIHSFATLDNRSRDILIETIKILFQAARNNIPALLPPKKPDR